jgi:hypothetical protein
MPAGLPGSTVAENNANPSAGAFVIFCPLSGPKGSPLSDGVTGRPRSIHNSTGGLCNGIGLQPQPQIGPAGIPPNWVDDQIPGTVTVGAAASGFGVANSLAKNDVHSAMMFIGGGRCVATENGIAAPDPYTAGISLLGAGEGGNRDAGAGPAFTGFDMKMVTAAADIANGDVIETGWVNRSGAELPTGYSSHGSAVAATATPS